MISFAEKKKIILLQSESSLYNSFVNLDVCKLEFLQLCVRTCCNASYSVCVYLPHKRLFGSFTDGENVGGKSENTSSSSCQFKKLKRKLSSQI